MGSVMRGAAIILLLLLSAAAAGSSPEAGLAVTLSEERLEAGDPQGAIEALLPHEGVEQGEVAFALAHAYFLAATHGRRPEAVDTESITQAMRHADRAISLGNAGGYNLLYMIHVNGIGVPQDTALAARYLKQGADAGDSGALLNYTYAVYYGNELFARDVPQACELIRRLEDHDRAGPVAAHLQGLTMIHGQCGASPDPSTGMARLRLAAEAGVTEAAFDLARALEHGVAGEPDLAEALRWYGEAAELGHPGAHWHLGMAFVSARGRPRDPVRAVEHFRQSAEGGHPDGMTSLAVMYATGDGVEQDFRRAFSLYEQAAAAGQPHALRGMGVMLALGQGVDVDLVRGREFYLRAVELGDPEDPALDAAFRSWMDERQLEEASGRFEAWKRARE
jgi:uncharacterized protein